jgi:glyoxylate/succinic semialdehyde reductase
MFALKGPAMVQGNYPTAFPLKHQQKDMRLALAAADTAAQPLTVAAAANQAYVKARQMGQGDADFSAVMMAVLQQQQSTGGHSEGFAGAGFAALH